MSACDALPSHSADQLIPTSTPHTVLTGFSVVTWTGDDFEGDLSELRSAHIICTTPEKWHSTTKRWRDQHERAVANSVGLVLLVRCMIHVIFHTFVR